MAQRNRISNRGDETQRLINAYTFSNWGWTDNRIIPLTTVAENKPKKKPKIEIFESKDGFEYGNCAITAIGSAFNMSNDALNVICRILKFREYNKGLTFFQCKKLINVISENKRPRHKVKYVANHSKVTFTQLVTLLNDKKLLVMFDEHLSYVEKGKVYDSYFTGERDQDLLKKPTGWWEIV